MDVMPINYIKADGGAIEAIVDQIEDVLEGLPTSHVTVACLVVAILSQMPDIGADKLQELVKGASEYIAVCLLDESKSGAIN
jgi:hypothetical protein